MLQKALAVRTKVFLIMKMEVIPFFLYDIYAIETTNKINLFCWNPEENQASGLERGTIHATASGSRPDGGIQHADKDSAWRSRWFG